MGVAEIEKTCSFTKGDADSPPNLTAHYVKPNSDAGVLV